MADAVAGPHAVDAHLIWQHVEKAREARERLDRILDKTGATGVVVGSHALAGRPDKEIVPQAGRIGAGLVVLGGQGLGPLRWALVAFRNRGRATPTIPSS